MNHLAPVKAATSLDDGRSQRSWPALRRWFGFEAIIAIAMVLTACAIYFQDALTHETLSFTPKDLGTAFYSYSYDDRGDGGHSNATVDQARPLAFSCDIRPGFAYPYCGFGITFDTHQKQKGLDLSGFDSISLAISYRGTSKLMRVDLRDKDPRYASLARVVDKANEADFPIRPGQQTVTLAFRDFSVADWWRSQTKAPPQLARPSFNNVVGLELLTGLDSGPGVQKFQIERITFHRTLISNEGWFGGIAIAWALLIGIAVRHRRSQIAILKRSAERALRESERLHRTILESSADCIVLLSPDGRIEYINAAGVDAFELPPAEQVTGRPWTAFWNPEEICDFVKALNRAAAGETMRLRGRGPTARGTRRWWDAIITPTLDDSGAVTGILTVSRDVTADRERSEQLKWASEHDALTHLPNRRSFHARLQAATLRAMQAGEQVGLLVIDLDHFKHINDSFGHSAGDELLKVVAERLRNCIRDKDLVARIGGDEFAILLEDVNSAEALLSVGAQVQERLRAPVRTGGRALCGGASIGGAIFPTNASTAHDLFKYADTALYELKQHGRGGTKLFDDYMLAEAEKMALQLNLARGALTEKTVVPLYQPKIDVTNGKAVGVEALLRWRHPRLGLQLPATLEEAFNDYELAAKIGDLMQQKVARDIRKWLDDHVQFGRVSINAAPAEFLRDDYAERLLAILLASNVPADRIEIEVTEHAFLGRGPEYVARALETLKEAGATVSLDDFGTGCSSLAHLRDFPVDVVKVDKSFVQQMTEDSEIAAIVAAVIDLANSLSISVVAEGVETPAQLDLLKVMGCRIAQGHLFGAAMQAEEIPGLMPAIRAAA
jgi:diguanylate cyclase (GGDEF)-like protein/PAS domain S-box-containing protein